MSLSSRAVALTAATSCPRLTSAASQGWSDTSLATKRGIVSISPRLAFQEGQDFERRIVGSSADGDDALRELLGVTGNVVRFPDGDATKKLEAQFTSALNDPSNAIILQGVVPGLYGGWHRPDILIRVSTTSWRVGEIKVYLDSGGHTPGHLVQSTAMQAAVAASALRRMGVDVDEDALIILSKGQRRPSLRMVNIAGEVSLIDELTTAFPFRTEEERVPDLAEHAYSPDMCEGRCALADICRSEVQAQSGVLWPGEGAASELGATHQELISRLKAGSGLTAMQSGWDSATPL